MSNPHVRTMRRAGVAALMVATLALSMTACGSDDGKEPKAASSKASTEPSTSDKDTGGGETVPDTSNILLTSKNDAGIDMVINTATRDSGGFLTVSGQFKNSSGSAFTIPITWNGPEVAVALKGRSLAGMTLVDSQGKKRYYVLRDTDNRPLTTTDYFSRLEAGKSLSFFAQFPAPPDTTAKVDLQFPGFANAPIEIS
ncbi:hypothetical protein [Streptomyces fulvorobeus]|uniref:Lipoprotein n=1 Tax=Streptomyces fulvorobeus TaxID=284028 RepID=A0A7J0CA80_9ACTN|nr:hypothetical protein [Streptomyces fulvorobeus]NYE42667.1 hypothetical protein [Streptomyces fulvorobeus]GFM99077.1 hypothetical protein Sfulv_38880 [Streptomyces fulvorobeus]